MDSFRIKYKFISSIFVIITFCTALTLTEGLNSTSTYDETDLKAVKAITPADQACIYIHNAIRITHNAPALTFSTTLQTLAKTCANYHANVGTPGSPTPPEIQCPNIAQSSTPGATELLGLHDLVTNGLVGTSQMFRLILWSWYQETGFSWATPVYGDAWRHKFQLIWKGTTQFACAMSDFASPTTNALYMSCLYTPAGNVAGGFTQNISPPLT